MDLRSRVVAWNERIAVRLTDGMSTMVCAYMLLIWSILPLPLPWTQDVVAYVSQDVIQLVALSIIMVGTKVSERSIRGQAAEDHQMIINEFNMLNAVVESERQEREELATLVRKQCEEMKLLREIHARVTGT